MTHRVTKAAPVEDSANTAPGTESGSGIEPALLAKPLAPIAEAQAKAGLQDKPGVDGVAALDPTADVYKALNVAYDFFNKELFDGRLPNCLLTLQRKRNALGFFAAGRFSRGQGEKVDEIALNPSMIAERTLEATLSTLVHEQVHSEEHHFNKRAKNPRPGYHTKAWGKMMKAVGLHPSHTGQPGGKETGVRMSHYIIPDGRFQQACAKLVASGYKFPLEELWGDSQGSSKTIPKYKFVCRSCGQRAWGGMNFSAICGDCKTPFERSRAQSSDVSADD